MPLIHVYLQEGKDELYLKVLGDCLHQTLIDTWGIPLLDRFQIIHQKSNSDFYIDQKMWDVERSQDVIVFHIFTSPRTQAMKLAFYEQLPRALNQAIGLRPEDVFISIMSNQQEDWSFGNGQAQLLD
jgi:hypothetical protein